MICAARWCAVVEWLSYVSRTYAHPYARLLYVHSWTYVSTYVHTYLRTYYVHGSLIKANRSSYRYRGTQYPAGTGSLLSRSRVASQSKIIRAPAYQGISRGIKPVEGGVGTLRGSTLYSCLTKQKITLHKLKVRLDYLEHSRNYVGGFQCFRVSPPTCNLEIPHQKILLLSHFLPKHWQQWFQKNGGIRWLWMMHPQKHSITTEILW